MYEVKYSADRTEYLYNGQLHRIGGPALEWPDGSKFWFQNGKLHRIDGPAIAGPSGELWYKNHKLHRLDGPAVEHSDGTKAYYINGEEYSELEFNFWSKCIHN